MDKEPSFNSQVKSIYHLLMVLFLLFIISGGSLIYYVNNPEAFSLKRETSNLVAVSLEEDSDRIENGVHVRTGLVEAEGLMTVVNNCTNCHSAKLVTQNRMDADGWNTTIKWMQETQNLWDLGGNHEIIVNYLVTNYPPVKKGRRMILTNVEWYELEE